MSMFHRILVPVDFSPFSLQALRYGCALARQDQAPLYLLHVVQDLVPIGIGGGGIASPSAAQYVSEIEKGAGEALAQVPSRSWMHGLTVLRQTIIGSPAERIVEFARSNDVDLICVGTHGRGGLNRFLLGSVAEKVVQHSACKVLVVRRREREFVTAESETPTLRRILVPIDFSETGRAALEAGADLASRFGAELHLLHVVEDSSPAVSEIALAYPVFQSYVHEMVRKGEMQLRELSLPQALPSKPIHRKVMIGAPIDKINDYAEEQDIDLIVIGTHGRTGPSHWLLGSVAERVVRSAPCPVLVTPLPKGRSGGPSLKTKQAAAVF